MKFITNYKKYLSYNRKDRLYLIVGNASRKSGESYQQIPFHHVMIKTLCAAFLLVCIEYYVQHIRAMWGGLNTCREREESERGCTSIRPLNNNQSISYLSSASERESEGVGDREEIERERGSVAGE